ncbi:MAG: DUF3991 domain-containing protein [Oscillospiraceae bacterium]|nr:DUF3991 domain-containing protein [Oscillospiraceae bacterium]
MPYIPPEIVEKARQVDLLTYLHTCEPGNLVDLGNGRYCTREHDSLKISNGKWYWFSKGVGGHTALDYLMKVQHMSFYDAVQQIANQSVMDIPRYEPQPREKRELQLPEKCNTTKRVYAYLRSRGIDKDIINFCIKTERLYESLPYHNAVFVGTDKEGKPRYAAMRGTGSKFKGEATGSDKRFSFAIPSENSTDLHLFESAIDLLSYATLCKHQGEDWQQEHLLSLAGIYKPKGETNEMSLPKTIKQYLDDHPEVTRISLHLDNDLAGREASKALMEVLSKTYEVIDEPPSRGKDFNEFLCMELCLPLPEHRAIDKER